MDGEGLSVSVRWGTESKNRIESHRNKTTEPNLCHKFTTPFTLSNSVSHTSLYPSFFLSLLWTQQGER